MKFDRHLPKLAFSIKEACQASSLGKTTIYAHIAAGRLKAVRIGGRTVIPADSLQALIINGDVCKASNTQ
jgi:excisionase family DNA binding protein